MTSTYKYFLLALIGLTFVLGACVTNSLTMREQVAKRVASPAWLVERQISSGPFYLTAYERMHERYEPATVYIEGDGETFIAGITSLANPTPKNPVALHLASKDNSKNLAYLARPCQYSEMVDEEVVCDSAYWGTARFSETVLEAYNTALNEIKARYNIEGFHLVGYSGGGDIAALLAAGRHDVLSLRTVASYLDHKAYTAYHEKPALVQSENPVDFAAVLKDVPQMHFSGGQDTVVPPALVHSYLQAVEESPCVDHMLIQEASHDEGWTEKWPELLKIMPECTPYHVVEEAEEPIYSPRMVPEKP